MLKYSIKGVLRISATNGKKNVNFSAARVQYITIYKKTTTQNLGTCSGTNNLT
jgi:hypothetical protein